VSDLLRVEDLWVRFPKRGGGMVEAVRGISFSVGRERVGIVGESGSGKSMTGRAILRLVRPPGEATASKIEFNGVELQSLTEHEMRRVTEEEADEMLAREPVEEVEQPAAAAAPEPKIDTPVDLPARVVGII
jgi:peptide/nickel transport system ATP-binding protein